MWWLKWLRQALPIARKAADEVYGPANVARAWGLDFRLVFVLANLKEYGKQGDPGWLLAAEKGIQRHRERARSN